MRIILEGKNIYIVNKKPQNVKYIEIAGTMLILQDDNQNLLLEGEICLKQNVKACLYCKGLKNITFIIEKDTVFNASLILGSEAQFKEILEMIRNACFGLELSEQNAKINGYAASLVEKFKRGVAVTIMDTKENEGVKYCSVCGMQCDLNIPYCMECGASV